MKQGRLNLLPLELRPTTVLQQEHWIGIAMAGFLMYVVLSIAYFSRATSNASLELLRAEGRNKILLTEFSEISKTDVPKDESELNYEKFRDLISKKSDWAQIFQELSVIAMKGVWIDELKTKKSGNKNTLVIEGRAPSLDRTSSFFNALESSYYFRKIRFNSAELIESVEPAQYKFVFEIDILKRKDEVAHAPF